MDWGRAQCGTWERERVRLGAAARLVLRILDCEILAEAPVQRGRITDILTPKTPVVGLLLGGVVWFAVRAGGWIGGGWVMQVLACQNAITSIVHVQR